MDRDPPNPYIDATLRELAQVLGIRAKQLLAGERIGRRDIAYLLMAVAREIDPQDLSIGHPAHRVREGGDPLAEFWPAYEVEKRNIQWRLFREAAEAVGVTPAAMLEHARTAGRNPSDFLLEGEEGLRAALAWLGQARSG